MHEVDFPALGEVARRHAGLYFLTSHRPAMVTAPGRRAVQRQAGGSV
jgi:hypothetical protein